MLNKIIVENHLGDALSLDLANPYEVGIAITDITGLGPGKAEVGIITIANLDGGRVNSVRMPTRNIVITLEIIGYNVDEIRHIVYKHFPIKKTIVLSFDTDERQSQILGVVESNEPVIFSSKQKIPISIVCPIPWFHAIDMQTTLFSGIEPLFEFEFENYDSETGNLEFGEIYNSTEKSVYYNGDVDVGLKMTIHAVGSAGNVTIYNSETREFVKLDSAKLTALTGSGIKNGDDIIIQSVTGSKSAYLLRDGTYTNIINCLDKGSSWFVLVKGDNLFAFSAETGTENLQFTVENQILFEGV